MHNRQISSFSLPNTPQIMKGGELTYKVILKDYVDTSGYSKLYLQCFCGGKRKLISLGIKAPAGCWDGKKQLARGRSQEIKDINLQVGYVKAKANDILVKCRLQNRGINLVEFTDRFLNPLPEYDFIEYFDHQLKVRKSLLEHGTWKHQKSCLAKLKAFKNPVPFQDINIQLINGFRSWLKVEKKNSPATINATIKTVKTYLNIAIKIDGIDIPFNTSLIKLKSFKSDRSFLSLKQLETLDRYYHSEFCPPTHRQTLQVFLFACYTGLRYSDLAALDRANIVGDRLVFVPHKTKNVGKVGNLKLTNKALRYLNITGPLFDYVYANQKGNTYLKEIARQCGIYFNLSWHVARHTFATAFLTLGGSVEVLQQLLGHSNVRETMLYTHIIDQRKDEEMDLFDGV